jgi:hypothetical protein
MKELMSADKPTDLGEMLDRAITNVRLYDQHHALEKRGDVPIHIPNVGGLLSAAYEQLRNASENIEDHLLFQRAILRFYKRNLSFISRKKRDGLGYELVVELTQAEYLENDSVTDKTVKALDDVIDELYTTYWILTDKTHKVSRSTAQKWVLELLSVKSEQLFNNPIRILSFAHVAHTHFTNLVDVKDFIAEDENIKNTEYQKLLYTAVHKALVKSDDANVRNALLDLYTVSPHDVSNFIIFNRNYDELAGSRTLAKLARVISRNGAPLRVLRATFFDKENEDLSPGLSHRSKTLAAVETQIDHEYKQLKKRLQIGVIKSIIFLLLTKAIVGFLIEIPYDLIIHGSIIILPLVVNLLFPSFFIALTGLTLKHPTETNKRAITDYIDAMLFVGSATPLTIKTTLSAGRTYLFNTVYVLMFIFVFFLVGERLISLGFNVVQGIIFFIFLSTASFLGYRLTLQVKELEIVSANQGFIALVRDFLYAPFIFFGRKISYRFAKMNIIAQILDTVIELPLKTILRLARQWTIFLSNKNDELL